MPRMTKNKMAFKSLEKGGTGVMETSPESSGDVPGILTQLRGHHAPSGFQDRGIVTLPARHGRDG
jgi:hypothetical protein